MSGYRVIPSVFTSASRAALAQKHSTLVTAVAAMGEGVVIDAENRVVAFHENHLRMLDSGVGDFQV